MNGPGGSRTCHVIKNDSEEFEFFLSVDGQRKGQIITSVTKDGPAYRAGLKNGDRVIGINGNNVEQKDHEQIVGIIRECVSTNEIKFVVIDEEHDPNAKKSEKKSAANADPRPRLCKIKKKNNSFGIFLEAGGDSGHFIKKVTKGGAADGTGLKDGDRVIAVNKTNVEKAPHSQVVDLIKKAGNKVALLVIEEEGYQTLKQRNVTITEKLVKGGSTSTKNSSSSASKQKSVKAVPAKTSKSSKKQPAKSFANKGKVRVVHILKHPEKGYGFFLRAKKNTAGEFVGNLDENGAAEQSGLQNDDRVMAVNGKSTDGMTHADVIGLVKTKKAQVVLVVMDEQARKHFEEKNDFPSANDIVHSHNHKVRSVKLTKGNKGYGMSLKMQKDCSFHIFSDVEKDGVADKAGLKDGEILIAVQGSSVLTDSHDDCIKKIKEAGGSVEMIVGSRQTSDFLLKVGIAIDGDLLKEWPTKEELEVPPFGKTPKPKEEKKPEVAAAVAEAVVEKAEEKHGEVMMMPRLCTVVRESGGFGFFLKDERGHYLANIENNSPAHRAGVLEHDRIIEINGENVEKYTHAEVVGKIRQCGNEVTFLVVNDAEDKFFKEKGIPITSSLLVTSDELAEKHKPRTCTLVRTADGYGFHLMGESGRKGQFVKELVKGGAADVAGLREGDRIVEVNGTNVMEESHDVVVKKITEKKEEVTFLIIDKEGEAYYKMRGLKIVAELAAVKAVAEHIDAEKKSIGRASASSSIIETEATVHQEAEENVEIEKVAAAVEIIVDKAEDEIASLNDEDQEDMVEEVAEEIKETIEEKLGEDEQEKLREAVEVLVDAAAAENIVDEVRDMEEEGGNVFDEPISEDVSNAIEDEIDSRNDEDEGLRPVEKVAVAVAVAEAVDEIRDIAAEESESHDSRPSSPEPMKEEEPQVIIPEETQEEITTVIQNHIEERMEEENEEDEMKAIHKATAALVAKEIADKLGDEGKQSDAEEEEEQRIEPTHEPEPRPPSPVVAPVVRPPTPPRAPSPEPEPPKPVVVVVAKPDKQEARNDPLSVVLNESGEIQKNQSIPEPDDQPKVPWMKFQLKSATRHINVGAAASETAKKEEPKPTAVMSHVAALKAAIEKRNREATQSSARDDRKNELQELSKQGAGASKHIQKFGGVAKNPQDGSAKKKNPWTGEGMTIKIIET